MTLLEEIMEQVAIAVLEHNQSTDEKFGSPQKASTRVIGLLKPDDGPEVGKFVCLYGTSRLFMVRAVDNQIILQCELIGGGSRTYTREQAEEMLKDNKFYAYTENLLKLKTSSPFSNDCFTIKNGEHEIRVHSNSRGATVTYLYDGMMVFEGASFSDLFGLDNLNQLINHVNNG